MRTKVDYGCYIDNDHYVMTKAQWITAMRIQFGFNPMSELNKIMRKSRNKELYRPCGERVKRHGYHVRSIAAYYHIEGNRTWWYIQNYGKETAVLTATVKCLNLLDIPFDQFDDLKDPSFLNRCEDLDPSWKPKPEDLDLLLEELTDINYHTLRGEIEERL